MDECAFFHDIKDGSLDDILLPSNGEVKDDLDNVHIDPEIKVKRPKRTPKMKVKIIWAFELLKD